MKNILSSKCDEATLKYVKKKKKNTSVNYLAFLYGLPTIKINIKTTIEALTNTHLETNNSIYSIRD